MLSYIYLLREREFLRLNENVYKIGKTEQEPNNRLGGYPKGTEVILFINTNNCNEMETKLIYIFQNIFKQRTDIGKEYFEGDKDYMVKIICDVINANNNNKILNINIENISNSVVNKDNSNKNKFIDNTTDKINQDSIINNKFVLEENNNMNTNKIKNILLSNDKMQEINNTEYMYNIESKYKYDCYLCNYKTNERQNWYYHKNGKKHKQKELQYKQKNNNLMQLNNKNEIELLKEKIKSLENQLRKFC